MGKGVPQAGQQTSKRQPDAGGVGWVSAQGAPDAQTRPTGAQGAPAPRTPPPQPQTTATDPPPPTTQPGAARRGGRDAAKALPPHGAAPARVAGSHRDEDQRRRAGGGARPSPPRPVGRGEREEAGEVNGGGGGGIGQGEGAEPGGEAAGRGRPRPTTPSPDSPRAHHPDPEVDGHRPPGVFKPPRRNALGTWSKRARGEARTGHTRPGPEVAGQAGPPWARGTARPGEGQDARG